MTLLGLLWFFTLWFGLSLIAGGAYVLMRWWYTR